jgi:hypothetical protein
MSRNRTVTHILHRKKWKNIRFQEYLLVVPGFRAFFAACGVVK